MISDRCHPVCAPITSRGLIIGTGIMAILLIGLAMSLWTILETSRGVLVLMWCAAWGVGAETAGWHLRN